MHYIISKKLKKRPEDEETVHYMSFPFKNVAVSDELVQNTKRKVGPGEFVSDLHNIISWRKEINKDPLGVITFELIEARRIASACSGTIEKIDIDRGKWIIVFHHSQGKAPLCGSRRDMFYFDHKNAMLTFNQHDVREENPWIIRFESKREAEIFTEDFPDKTGSKLSVENINEFY